MIPTTRELVLERMRVLTDRLMWEADRQRRARWWRASPYKKGADDV